MVKDYKQLAKCQRCNEIVICQNCDVPVTTENPFLYWFRRDRRLAMASLVRYDNDILLHKYRTYVVDGNAIVKSRDVQYMMVIEVKTFNAVLDPAQEDTLGLLSQMLMCSDGKYLYSSLNKKDILLRCFGAHVLTMDGDTPENSSRIDWDGRPIDTETLIAILTFQVDPNNLEPMIER